MPRRLDVQLVIAISKKIKHVTSTVCHTANSASNRVREAPNEGECSEITQTLKHALVTPLNSIEFVSILVKSRGSVEVGVAYFVFLATFHDQRTQIEIGKVGQDATGEGYVAIAIGNFDVENHFEFCEIDDDEKCLHEEQPPMIRYTSTLEGTKKNQKDDAGFFTFRIIKRKEKRNGRKEYHSIKSRTSVTLSFFLFYLHTQEGASQRATSSEREHKTNKQHKSKTL